MLFTDPIPFIEALDILDEKSLLPTTLKSAEIRQQWDADLKQRALFSARMNKADILQAYKSHLGDLLNGKTNIASVRAEMMRLYDDLGFNPEAEGIEKGSLEDHSSRTRIDLVLQTNMRQVANFGYREQGQSDFSLHAYPCYEFLRIYPRSVPRGERRGKEGAIVPDPGQDWPSRWEKVGGDFYDGGRMVARKDATIWDTLGDSTIFSDGLDAPVPPFAFNSGFGWREVPRADCVEMGVIDADTDIQGTTRSMNQGLQAAAKFDPEFLKALKEDLDLEIAEGKARIKAAKEKRA